MFTLRDKGIIVELAKYYNLKYRIRSKESNNKFKYLLEALINIYKISKEFKPDIFLDMGTIVASPVAKISRKPYIAFDDTEVSVKSRLLHMPFTDIIITPNSFNINLGVKQIKFNGCMELLYLHKHYFKPDPNIKDFLNVKKDEKYVLLRFVSWTAHHDKGIKGFSDFNKSKAVSEFSKYAKVFISSEEKLPVELEFYRIIIPPHKMHDVLAGASLVFGESATMASESAVLGTPAIYLDKTGRGYTDEEERYGLVYNYSNDEYSQISAIKKGIDLLKDSKVRNKMKSNHNRFLKERIEPTSFIVWFIENYPKSAQIMRENPDYQLRFK